MRYNNETKTKTTGAIYTPTKMAEYVAAQIMKYAKPVENGIIAILDPAVGEGELLIAMINALSVSQKRIKAIGYETDEEIVNKTQERLSMKFPDANIEIRKGDFLEAVEENAAGLYDFVIANPPYIRTQIMGSSRAQAIASRLSLSGRIDIYYAFMVYAREVLKPNGVAGFITSNKFMTIKAGTDVRNYILDNYTLYHITDFGDTKLFDASVLPCVVVFSLEKTSDQNTYFTSIYETKNDSDIKNCVIADTIFDLINESSNVTVPDGRCFKIQQGVLNKTKKDSLWTISLDSNTKWLSRVEANTWFTFSQIGKVRVGIKTTADKVFIGNNWTGEKADLELLRPLITHRNAGQILPNRDSYWQVLYTHRVIEGKRMAVDIDDYPKSKMYLLSHYNQLSSREYVRKAKRNWYEIWVPRNPAAWSHKKIVFRDISEKPEFWYDSTGSVVNGDCYWIDVFPETLEENIFLALAVANSSFIEKFYDVKFNTKLYSGKRRFQSQYVEQFPIPYYGSSEAQEAIRIVKQIIKENTQDTLLRYKPALDVLVEKMFS